MEGGLKKVSTYQGAGFGCLGAILVVFFMLMVTLTSAQHNPMVVPCKLIGDVGTLELYYEAGEWDDYLIFYSFEDEPDWASVRLGEHEIIALYQVIDSALRGGVYKFAVRQTEFEFNVPAFGRGTIKISDPDGRDVTLKVNRDQLRRLFNIEL